jgi:hypothetical protein
MPNGTLKLYNKLDNTLLVSLDILGTFNIEDNLNDTPSNMKVKVITSNVYREEFQVNTIAYHEDTNTWWVIKSDESTYITTGEYEHEIQLVELLEFYAYRHLPNCAFAPNTYTLEQMLLRLFDIAKLSITVIYPDFLDEDKIMPFFSFENFTVANAIKNISRSINAIPKMSSTYPYELFTGTFSFGGSTPPTGAVDGTYWFSSSNILRQRISGSFVVVESTFGTTTPIVGNQSSLRFVNTATQQLFITSNTLTPTLTFINRNGSDNAIVNVLDTQFPIAYEKNMNSNDQFTTRSVSNITNAKSSSLVVLPQQGGFKNISPNSLVYDENTARVLLPSKIDKIDFIRIFPPMQLVFVNSSGSVLTEFAKGYFTSRDDWYNKIVSTSFGGYTTTQKQNIANELPEPNEHFKVNYGETDISSVYNNITALIGANPQIRMFGKKMTIYNKFEFDTIDNTTYPDLKERSVHWTPFSNEIIMPLSFRNGLSGITDHNRIYRLFRDGITENEVWLRPLYKTTGFFNTEIAGDEILIQVGYYPISDIKVSIDNDNDAQDEKFFNQSGKVIDAVSVSKLITSHTNDSVEGTKIRNARYASPDYDYTDILPLGQLVRDSNQIYVVSQRSIDGMVKNSNEYYNVIYTLSRNRIARSENIIADGSVISYKTPDDNLVFRTQLYKDYIELSLQDINQDIPYLPMTKALQFGGTLAGTNFDYTVLAKNSFGTTPTIVRYVKNPTTFELHKSKLMNVNWQSNNLLGYRLDSTGGTYVQTPILYTDNLGNATNFELLFLDINNIINARTFYNSNFTPTSDIIPFADLTNVVNNFYTNSVINQSNFSIRIQEDTSGGRPYQKDPFEIPVFEYMIQGNDDYNPLGNVVIGNDLFTDFRTATGTTMRYHYQISNTRFTAENAIKLFTLPSSTNRVVGLNRVGKQIGLTLYSVFNPSTTPPTLTQNTTEFNHVGIYAYNGVESKFLFAINDYSMSSDSQITLYINNWKI